MGKRDFRTRLNPPADIQTETVTISKKEYEDLTNDKSYIADEEIQKMISTLQYGMCVESPPMTLLERLKVRKMSKIRVNLTIDI